MRCEQKDGLETGWNATRFFELGSKHAQVYIFE